VTQVQDRLKPFLSARIEVGSDQKLAARYFSSRPTSRIEGKPPTWPMTSDAAALALGFLGVRKLEPRPGIIRGISVSGGYPYIYDDWDLRAGKKATHECWVGATGVGKTFALNNFLARSLAHYGIPFDLLEPMGHGQLLAQAFNIDAYSLSSRRTCLNPHDPVYPRLGDQIAHVIRLYETFLGRTLQSDQQTNHQRSLLSQALTLHYDDHDLSQMTPQQAPLVEDVAATLARLGNTDYIRQIAREFAEEIAGLATGSGPYAHFLNGRTNVDFSIAHEHAPRIFCFHEMDNDPTLIAIAYTQVLATLMRTALADDSPRIIAVDEVYRMMKHPGLQEFLVQAVKLLRTKRKKVIVIDQQMRVFLSTPTMRLLFENCPIRVIFSQKGGEDIFWNDPTFAHYTDQHRRKIAELPRFQFMMETQ
jgi:type IV secretory pathway VirB4 component